MKKFKLLLFEKLYSLKNLIKIATKKYSLETFTITIFFFLALYIIISQLNIKFDGLQLNGDFTFILNFFINEFIIGNTIFSFIVLSTSRKCAYSYWKKVKIIPISSSEIYFFYLALIWSIYMIFFLGFLLIIFHCLNVKILFAIKFLIIFITYNLSIVFSVVVIENNINCLFNPNKVDLLLTYIIIGICNFIQIILYKYLEYSFVIKFIIILTMPIVIVFITRIITRKKECSFKKYFSKIPVEVSVISKNLNNYFDILIIESVRNRRIYTKFIFIPIFVTLVVKISSKFAFNEILFATYAVTSTVVIGLYNSYNQCFKLLPIKNTTHLLFRGILSFILLNFILIIINFISGMNMIGYLDSITMGINMFIIVYLYKIPIIKNGNENVAFYIFTYFCASAYSIFIEIMIDIFNSILNLDIYSIYINMIITLTLLIILVLKEKGHFYENL